MYFRHRTHKIQARSDLKPPPQGLASIVPEGAMQAAKNGNTNILPRYDVYEPQQGLAKFT